MTTLLRRASFCALLIGLALVALISEIWIERFPLSWFSADGQMWRTDPAGVRACIGARALASLGDTASAAFWSRCAHWLVQGRALDEFGLRYWISIVTAVITLSAAIAFALALRSDRASHRVVRGRHLLTGNDACCAFKRSAKHEAHQSGKGLDLLPGLAVSRDRETRHWLVWGSVGAGKTQTMLHLILAAIARGDGVLVIDVKGDMTATLPGDPLLIAPQDQRSLIWDVARDCRTKQDARELAARLIPDSQDPMWSDAAREIVVVCLSALQATKGDRWTWRDLHDLGTGSAESLLALAQRFHIDAVRLLENPDSRTTQSILSTFQAHMHVVAALSEAWADGSNRRFSISEWLHSPTPYRPVILQHDPRYPGLSSIWIGGMLALLASAVGSPSLTESRDRRIWIFADEFPQLPRLNNFSTFLDLGRSKGVIAVICAQDLAQLRATYGQQRADAWVGMIGTKIITRLNAGRGAEEASHLIGDQEIEREERSETVAGGKSSVTTMRRREFRRVITADEIARLGPRGDHIRVLLLGLGNDVLELRVPFVSLPALRPGHVPAAWLKPLAIVGELPLWAASKPRSVSLLSPDAAARIREMSA